ncbi:MAG: protein phosphatase CheZ, partial [Paucimonas sp.]|nr:protein phosphatase CheZ [Paucimonas sp.]
MTSAADEFEALFDEVAAQRAQSLTEQTSSSSAAEMAVVMPAEDAIDGTAVETVAESGIDGDEQIYSSSIDEDQIYSSSSASSAESLKDVDLSSKPMYERLGNIVRMLHDSLRELGYDRSLSNVATQINDAQGRLEHIASLTEQAATKVLNTIDIGLPQQEELGRNAKVMEERWTALFDGKLTIDEFKLLANDSKEFASRVMQSTDTEKARLLDIMMAQDFQDITGQLIKKIVGITHTAEVELAQILKDN